MLISNFRDLIEKLEDYQELEDFYKIYDYELIIAPFLNWF